MATGTRLITAEEYSQLGKTSPPSELVRGVVVDLIRPGNRHGRIRFRAAHLIENFAEPRQLGRAFTNDSGVVTQRDPDTVRGPDVSYYSFAQLPRGDLVDRYTKTPPEIAIEVRLPDDSFKDLVAKAVEYLDAGVKCVCILDPKSNRAHVYSTDDAFIVNEDENVTFPGVLEGFQVKLSEFFRD